VFLDQGELDSPSVTSEMPGSLPPAGPVEMLPSGKKVGKNQKLLLVVLLVVVVLGVGYVLFGMSKGNSTKLNQVTTSPAPAVSQVTTTTSPQSNSYKVAKNPFVPVGSPGVNIANVPSPSSPTTTAAAG
jgi:uncharacterized protein HemX